MSKKGLTQQEILMFLNSVPTNRSAVELGNRKVTAKVFYVSQPVASILGNNGQLLMPKDLPSVGENNFPKGNLLPKGKTILVTGVRLLAETTANKTTDDAEWKSEVPAAVKNGEFSIRQGNTLLDVPNTAIANFKGVPTASTDDVFEVIPFIIRPEVNFELKASFAANPTGTHLLRYELYGYEIEDNETAS